MKKSLIKQKILKNRNIIYKILSIITGLSIIYFFIGLFILYPIILNKAVAISTFISLIIFFISYILREGIIELEEKRKHCFLRSEGIRRILSMIILPLPILITILLLIYYKCNLIVSFIFIIFSIAITIGIKFIGKLIMKKILVK